MPLLTNPTAVLVSAFALRCNNTGVVVSEENMACTIDFRCLDEGFGGKTYKRKRAGKEAPDDVSEEDATAMKVEKENVLGDGVIAGKETNLRRYRESVLGDVSGKATYDSIIARKVSGRKWKQARTHKSSAVQNEIEKRQKTEEREKRKKKNILKSGTKFQKITNPKTLKKIAKSAKHKKLLKVVYDDLLKAGNK
nr:rRNA-processing protein CGR1 [Ipomoea batatas]